MSSGSGDMVQWEDSDVLAETGTACLCLYAQHQQEQKEVNSQTLLQVLVPGKKRQDLPVVFSAGGFLRQQRTYQEVDEEARTK